MKQALYVIIVFGTVGLGLYIASNFQKQKFLKICKEQSNSLGGIQSCLEYNLKLDS